MGVPPNRYQGISALIHSVALMDSLCKSRAGSWGKGRAWGRVGGGGSGRGREHSGLSSLTLNIVLHFSHLAEALQSSETKSSLRATETCVDNRLASSPKLAAPLPASSAELWTDGLDTQLSC